MVVEELLQALEVPCLTFSGERHLLFCKWRGMECEPNTRASKFTYDTLGTEENKIHGGTHWGYVGQKKSRSVSSKIYLARVELVPSE